MDSLYNKDVHRADNMLKDIPLGLGMALMQNMTAFDAYSRLTEAERAEFISGAAEVRSKNEMKDYVTKLGGIK